MNPLSIDELNGTQPLTPLLHTASSSQSSARNTRRNPPRTTVESFKAYAKPRRGPTLFVSVLLCRMLLLASTAVPNRFPPGQIPDAGTVIPELHVKQVNSLRLNRSVYGVLKLIPQPDIQSQFRRHSPIVLNEESELHGLVRHRGYFGQHVLVIGEVDQQRCEVVSVFYVIRTATSQDVLRRIVLVEGKSARSVAGLEEIVEVDAPLAAEFNRVLTRRFRCD